MSFRFDDHYIEWRQARMNAINKYIPSGFFKKKNLLELGGGLCHNGYEFHKLGSLVTSTEVREEYVMEATKMFPELTIKQFDCEKSNINTKYDIILHWGVLYHIKEIETHIQNVCKNCDILLLETCCIDSDDDNVNIIVPEKGPDQAYHNYGNRTSPNYVEKIITKNGFKCRMIKDELLNTSEFRTKHYYTWDINNTLKDKHPHKGTFRRFWICWNENFDMPFLV
jgi:hypothetical protein